MKAIVFSNVSPRELNGKFSRLMEERGLAMERVVPCKQYAACDLSKVDAVVATIEGTLSAERDGLKKTAENWGKRLFWVALRATHEGWGDIERAVNEMGRQQLAEPKGDWQSLAEKYAEENDSLRGRCVKLDTAVSELREKLKHLESAAAHRREDQERVEQLEADLAQSRADSAATRKRLAEAIDARARAEARADSVPEPSRAERALLELLDAGVLTAEEVIAKLRRRFKP